MSVMDQGIRCVTKAEQQQQLRNDDPVKGRGPPKVQRKNMSFVDFRILACGDPNGTRHAHDAVQRHDNKPCRL